jgi:hypothetical protein
MSYKNEGKPELALVNPDFLDDLARKLQLGEEKHKDHHYRNGVSVTKLLSAMKRHIQSIERGEYYDEDELQHTTAVAAGAMMLHWMIQNHTGYAEYFDQPFKKERTRNAYANYQVLDEDDGYE